MGGAGHDVERCGDAGRRQSLCVRLVLVVEQLDVAGADPRGRQTREIQPPRGDRIVGYVDRPEVGGPADTVGPVVSEDVPDGVQLPVRRGAVVEHRAEQPLRHRLGATPVVVALHQARGQATARALAADCHAPGVDTPRRRVLL